ncbi:MAG: hypothetical protein DWQ07_25615 [Chloroflexi bacterium]|nr:MAG: hypothetical protein DWQ07_25615 [Chloroflexota bacterium]MBL1197196.1 hypothetical protein [Chloroflexota bacterium]NOH14490.1 hypothetical protein [Chloroflexota bacterium]
MEIVKPTLYPKTWVQYSQVCKQYIILSIGIIKVKDL